MNVLNSGHVIQKDFTVKTRTTNAHAWLSARTIKEHVDKHW